MTQVSTIEDPRELSKYFARFERLRRACEVRTVEYSEAGHPCTVVDEHLPLTLMGDQMLVEKLPKVDLKRASGIIISSAKSYKGTFEDDVADFGIVLLVGPGQLLDDGTIIKPQCRAGDVVMLPGGIHWYSQFGHLEDYEPYTIGRTRDAQVPISFNDYKKTFEVLNEKI